MGKISVRRGCLRLLCWCFTDSGAEGENFDVKQIQNGCKRVTKNTYTEPKGCQNEPRDLQKHPLRNRIGKVKKRGVRIHSFREPWLVKIRSKISSTKERSLKNIEFDTKGVPNWRWNRCQNSSKINAKTETEKARENNEKSCFF